MANDPSKRFMDSWGIIHDLSPNEKEIEPDRTTSSSADKKLRNYVTAMYSFPRCSWSRQKRVLPRGGTCSTERARCFDGSARRQK